MTRRNGRRAPGPLVSRSLNPITLLVLAALALAAGCTGQVAGWTDWRGPQRDGVSPDVPARLPAQAKFLWQRRLSSVSLAGLAATDRYVIVADKDARATRDIWRCLDADTGEQVWSLEYPAPGEMDYSNSPRANPVIHDGLAYLLGAFGQLHCVRLGTGEVVWKRNILKDFGAPLVTWGVCSTPLVVDDKLIVNPGAKAAAVVALDRRTGEVIWKTPGREAAYASFIVGTFGGVRQIVGYDATSLGGWDVRTGKRLWELIPPAGGDFNVPTPINDRGRLLVTTENNGTRMYAFDDTGGIIPEPIARRVDLAPDTSTPVIVGRRLLGCSGSLLCLDLDNGLKILWEGSDDALTDYASLIAGNGRVLITTIDGELLLVDATADEFRLISRLRLFEEAEIWSHPALVGNRLYVRDTVGVVCLLLDGD